MKEAFQSNFKKIDEAIAKKGLKWGWIIFTISWEKTGCLCVTILSHKKIDNRLVKWCLTHL